MSREVLVVGYAKLPQETAARALYGTLAVGAIVQVGEHTVVDAWTTLATPQTNAWVSTRLIGTNLLTAPDAFIDEIQTNYWGGARAAICQAFRDMVRRYHDNLESERTAQPR
ncbi:DUF3870 domain-containing protein [Streptomyces sp. MI02-2A]|uniref:DUF3870 domain-containing protein n=1 Tax=Streptomyces sp. MI02-2A TaxID=3028688 RepID=UPI0029A7320F|nr:DUF3870 domain-containing protein [Streptomyces sp. MI02-2A]MDX3264990.1 DUF3870 domain-containing protein [Streptomyces sp. MI02-2A]